MSRPSFEVIEVSSWLHAHDEALGTKPKRWLRHPDTDEIWLMKDTTFNVRADGSKYAKGDDWAERIAFAVAQELKLPVATVELAEGGPGPETERGIISRFLLAEGESLVHGNELLEEIGVPGSDPHDRAGYTLQAVRDVLERVDAPHGTPGLSAWDVFVGYLVLDAIVGNTDRHQENWAAIAVGHSRRLAPSFDHASCLGFQLDDQQRAARLGSADKKQTPEAYAERARSRFENKPKLLDLASKGLSSVSPETREHWLEPCRRPNTFTEIVDLVPGERMSSPSRDFARRVLHHNASRLVSHPFDTVEPWN